MNVQVSQLQSPGGCENGLAVRQGGSYINSQHMSYHTSTFVSMFSILWLLLLQKCVKRLKNLIQCVQRILVFCCSSSDVTHRTARQCSPFRRKFMECYIIKPAQSLLMKHLVIGQR